MSSSQFPTKQIARLTGHNGQVLAVTYSAGSGQYILTGSSDRTIRLFNPLNSSLIQSYSAHGHSVLDLNVASDNSRFISSGGDKTLFLWDVATAQTLRRWTSCHAARINTCAFAGENDALLVTGSFDSTVKIWDTKQRGHAPVMTFSEARDSVSCVEVQGHEIMTGSVDGRVRCYDVRMGCLEQDVIGCPVTSVMTTKTRDSYLVSTLDSTLRLIDKRDGKLLQAFRDEDDGAQRERGRGFTNKDYRIRSTLAAKDSLVVSGSEDGMVYVWDVMSGKVLHRLSHVQKALPAGDSRLTFGSGGGRKEGGEGGKKEVVSAVVWNQLRQQWASAGSDGAVVVWGA